MLVAYDGRKITLLTGYVLIIDTTIHWIYINY